MAGYLVGSAIVTWLLCSALNGLIEYAAIRGWFDRARAFIAMIAGVLVIGAFMVWLSWFVFPVSTRADLYHTASQISMTQQASSLINVLLAVGYCAFQLRRYWEDD